MLKTRDSVGDSTIATPIAAIDLAPRAAQRSRTSDAKRARVQWLDVAKGIGIVLVVIGHAIGGIIDSPAGMHVVVLRYLFLAIYLFHMPLFFLLSGLLVRERLTRSRHKFATDLIRSIAIPYFFWSIVQFTIIYAAGDLVNRPVGTYWPAILSLPWRTISQFWFLWVLFVLHASAWAIVPRLGSAVFLAIAVLLWVVQPIRGMPHLAITHAPFYAIGVAIAAEGIGAFLVQRSLPVRRLLLPAAAAIAVAGMTLMIARQPGFVTAYSPDIAPMAWQVRVAPISLIAIAAIIGLASTITGRAADMMASLGQSAMAIFVLHILFIAGIRILCARALHLHDPVLLLIATCATGLAGPLIIRACARRVGIPKLFGIS